MKQGEYNINNFKIMNIKIINGKTLELILKNIKINKIVQLNVIED